MLLCGTSNLYLPKCSLLCANVSKYNWGKVIQSAIQSSEPTFWTWAVFLMMVTKVLQYYNTIYCNGNQVRAYNIVLGKIPLFYRVYHFEIGDIFDNNSQIQTQHCSRGLQKFLQKYNRFPAKISWGLWSTFEPFLKPTHYCSSKEVKICYSAFLETTLFRL